MRVEEIVPTKNERRRACLIRLFTMGMFFWCWNFDISGKREEEIAAIKKEGMARREMQ